VTFGPGIFGGSGVLGGSRLFAISFSSPYKDFSNSPLVVHVMIVLKMVDFANGMSKSIDNDTLPLPIR
jgi:hypothetical protein